jgi:hypothetical protein
MAARALARLDRPDQARVLLERLLLEQPGSPEATHDLQTLVPDPAPPPPRPPRPPPPRPASGAREDELEGLRQRLPGRPQGGGGVKDL